MKILFGSLQTCCQTVRSVKLLYFEEKRITIPCSFSCIVCDLHTSNILSVRSLFQAPLFTAVEDDACP